MPLFRPESLRSQDRLHGDVNLAPPTSWQLIGGGVFLLFAAAGLFLGLSRYARVATAPGVIEGERGVVHVASTLSGVVERVRVVEGMRVSKGQVLAVVSHATSTDQGQLEARRADAIADERAAVDQREPSIRRSSAARVSALRSEADAARTDQNEIAEQTEQQRALVAAAEQDLDRVREVAKRGFISLRDVRLREETLAGRRQGLSRLQQSMVAARTAQRTAEERIGQERADLASSLSEIAGSRAGIAARAADAGNVSSTTLVASTDGIVSGVPVVGQTIGTGASVMDIVPSGGRLRVRLRLPAEAVAMVAPGQTARIAVDAFPYQTYGTLQARIEQVSGAAVTTGDATGFVAIASLAGATVSAYGVRRAIRPGMAVTARIRTMDRTLGQWLLDPLYAVARR
jgi:membrane fusion protein